MESVESELLKNLENLFGFQFGKGKKFQDLDTHDFLDVYKIFFRIYDSAWLLSDGKPKTFVLKQIQRSVNFFFFLCIFFSVIETVFQFSSAYGTWSLDS